MTRNYKYLKANREHNYNKLGSFEKHIHYSFSSPCQLNAVKLKTFSFARVPLPYLAYGSIYVPRLFVLHLLITVKWSKAVPLHAMKALGGRGDIAATHSRPRH
jgi:hypothetical protein